MNNNFRSDWVTPKLSLGTPPIFWSMGKKPFYHPNCTFPLSNFQKSHEAPLSPQCKAEVIHSSNWKRKEKRLWRMFFVHQSRFKRWFDKKPTGTNEFNVCDLILRWDKANEEKGKHTKFQALWIGSF